MKSARYVAAATLAAGVLLGCTRETSHGPVQWTASNPASPAGQTAAQAWSRSTSNDANRPLGEVAPTPAVAPAPAGTCGGEVAPAPAPMAPGVTSPQPAAGPQPPAARWPYDGVTLVLTPIL